MSIDKEQARYLLRDLDVDEWMTAGTTFPPKTFVKRSLRALPHLEMLLRPSQKSFASIQIKKMIEWVQNSVGDAKLAEELASVERSGKSYYEQCLASYELVKKRCEELQRALEGEDV